MTDTLTAPAPSGVSAVALDPKEQAAIATPVPVPADDAAHSISEASKALREKALAQPRNEDGTWKDPFAPKPVEAPATDAAPSTEPVVEAPTEDAAAEDPAPTEEEPNVFVLKGETSRGETDIELDVSGLPAEVIERLETLEKRGMRASEYKQAMQKIKVDRADLDAVETEMRVDAEGFMLNRIAPASRLKVAETLLLDQWDALAPLIEQLWTDDAGRMRRLSDTNRSIQDRRTDVLASVQASREAANARAAVSEMIPDNTTDGDAQEFFASSVAILQQKAMAGEAITPQTIPHILAAHRRRFFTADAAAATTPPARPKLAVRSAPSAQTAKTGASVVLPQAAVKAQTAQRAAAFATARTGAGAGAVERPGPGANATVEEASAWFRAQKGR